MDGTDDVDDDGWNLTQQFEMGLDSQVISNEDLIEIFALIPIDAGWAGKNSQGGRIDSRVVWVSLLLSKEGLQSFI